MSKILAEMAALSLTLQGQAAVASICSTHVEELGKVNPNYWTKRCRRVNSSPAKFLQKIRAGKISDARAWAYAIAFAKGGFGCEENDNFAFEIANTIIGWPIADNVENWKVYFLSYHIPISLEQSTAKEIRWQHWIRNPDRRSGLPYSWTEDEARSRIVQPGTWELLRKRFGKYETPPLQNELVLDELMNPKGERFNLDDAFVLIQSSNNISIEREVTLAELFIDPAIGRFAYEKAALLLRWYTPHVKYEIDQRLVDKAGAIWVRIAQNMLGSGNPSVAKEGHAILRTGNPMFRQPLELAAAKLPDLPNLLVLNEWPAGLPSMPQSKWERLVRPNDYPRRLLQQEQEGAIRLAALFKPDGSFADLAILNSSGHEKMDAKTKTSVLRRYRPRLKEMKLGGYHGKNVLIPLPVIEWHIPPTNEPQSGASYFEDGRVKVIARREKFTPQDTNYSCYIGPYWG